MKRDARLLPLLASLGLLFSQVLLAADSDVLAVVNGKKITAGEINRYAAQGGDHNIKPEMALQELINIELISADAIKKKYDKEPEFIAALEAIKKSQLASYAVRKAVASAGAPTAAEIKAEYERITGEMPKYEYQAHHVMVDSEEAAQGVIAALAGGAKIEEVARDKSLDESGQQGGDLGWFSADQMEPAFAAAVKGLKKGEYTKAPVQSSYGWHVIQLDDSRDLEPPPLAQVEEQIRNSLLSQRFQRYIDALRATAKIEIK
jgi:peptidyl-prolyl cis-trans isomerase C